MEENNEQGLVPFMDADALIASVEESSVGDKSAQLSLDMHDILRLRKFGEKYDLSPWKYGEGNEVHPESVWVIDPNTFRHGWMGWEGDGQGGQVPGQLPDEMWGEWNLAWPEKPEELPHVKEAYAFHAVCISSPLADQVGDYVSLSDNKVLGLNTYAALEQALRKRAIASKTNRELLLTFYPKVMFGFEEIYLKKRGGTFHKPVVSLVGWASKRDVTVATIEATAGAEPAPSADDDGPQDSQPAGTRAQRRRA